MSSVYSLPIFSILKIFNMGYYIFRHWESDNLWRNPDEFFPDIEEGLTLSWIRQVNLLVKNLLDTSVRFKKIFSSPKNRALQTSHMLLWASCSLGWVVEVVKEIRPRFYGDWEWKEKKLYLKNPEVIASYYTNPHFAPPNWESNSMVFHRVQSWIRTILANDDWIWDIAISTHSRIVECFYRFFVSQNGHNIHPFSVDKLNPRFTQVLRINIIWWEEFEITPNLFGVC